MASLDLHEKANFTRLSRLLVDKGTEALRTALDTIHPPANLPAVLNAYRSSLLKLKHRVISDSQWDLLFPPSGNPPDSKTFDVTLVTILLRNICVLHPPASGWNTMPPDTDSSLEANIARIKLFRNQVYAHVISTQVDQTTFDDLWQKISQALLHLKIPQKDIDDLRFCALDPEEEIYVQTLKNWRLNDDDCKNMLANMQKQLFRSGVQQRDDRENLNNSMQHLTHLTEETHRGVQELSSCSSKLSENQALQKLAKHNFRSKIRRKVKLFHPGTRVWLLKIVKHWFTREKESRLLLITAGPGFGKSVFAAKVCEAFREKEKLAACHFCDFSDSNLKDPMMLLQSLASHMCENITGFKERLVDQLNRPHKVHSLKDAFQIYLQNPLDELEVQKSLIVIDGLDESAMDGKSEMVKLIADYFPELPECVKVLITSRPGLSLQGLNDIQRIEIDATKVENNEDLLLYLKFSLPTISARYAVNVPWQIDHVFSILHILVSKCEGSFLYAFHVQRELSKRENVDTISLTEIMDCLPEGLGSVYQTYFQRLEIELKAVLSKNPDLYKLLEIFVAARRPIPLNFIARSLALDSECREVRKIINKVNEAVSCLLYVSDDSVVVFHKSVYDWLLAMGYKEHEYTVKVSDGKKRLWLICEEIFKEIKRKLSLENQIELTTELGDLLQKILESDVAISLPLRQQMSWHYLEIFCDFDGSVFLDSTCGINTYYVEKVLNHSPEGCFTDYEKKCALLGKDTCFLKRNSIVTKPPKSLLAKVFSSKIVAFGVSSSKKLAAVALDDGVICVLSLPNLVKLWQHSTEYNSISCCTFAPDDSFILYGVLQTVVNVAERTKSGFFEGRDEKFKSCVFSPNGKTLVTVDGSKTVKVWDVVKQSVTCCLDAGGPVDSCSFVSTGLFIIADTKNGCKDSYCVWSAVSFQRVDQRRVSVSKPRRGVVKSERCNRCFWQETKVLIPHKSLEIGGTTIPRCSTWYLRNSIGLRSKEHKARPGIYNGLDCIFYLNDHLLRVIESMHFTTLATLDIYVKPCMSNDRIATNLDITAIQDDLWLYDLEDKLVLFSTLPPKKDDHFPSCQRRILWCCFSPDGTRLATCTSDGFVNLWNVDDCQIYRRFQANIEASSAACWWSDDYLFVFHITHKIPSLSKYPVDENLKTIMTLGEPVLHYGVVDEFLPFSRIIDFSEGLLIFDCGEKEPVKVLDVTRRGNPKVILLPEIVSIMSIAVSTGASVILGVDELLIFLWKRNAHSAEYEMFARFRVSNFVHFSRLRVIRCCFINDLKFALAFLDFFGDRTFILIDANTGMAEIKTAQMRLFRGFPNLFCTNMAAVLLTTNLVELLDLNTFKLLGFSFQRTLTQDSLILSKLSPRENVLAVPNVTGDMEFFQLNIPQHRVQKKIFHLL